MMEEDVTVSEQIQKDGENEAKILNTVGKAQAKFEEAIDAYDVAKKIKYVPNTNFTECNSSGTLLPINMASETIVNLSRLSKKHELTEFVRQKLGYNTIVQVCMSFSSEQIEAIAMIIEQIEAGKGFILGDMAGVGKGRSLAGVQRYCVKNGIIPVFLTAMPNLFSEMYKDIYDIHGFGELKIDKFVKPDMFIYNDSSDIEASIRDGEGNPIPGAELLSKSEVDSVCASGKLPKGKNCIWLSYSQIVNTKNLSGKQKCDFLLKLAPKCIFIFDESHEAAGKDTGKLGSWARQIVSACKAVVFASATYAKRPEAFGMYAIRTALSESQIPVSELEEALDIGGENVSEYIASVMVAEGQMIRRERSYGGCDIKTKYKDDNVDIEDAKKKVYETFDNATRHFRELHGYIKSDAFRGAVNNAIYRAANTASRKRTYDVELVDIKDWNKNPSTLAPPIDVNGIAKYLNMNDGKYLPKFSYDTIGSGSRREFSENLFLALKADFTADTIIQELRTRDEYKYTMRNEEVMVKTNRKPIVAVRKTQQSIIQLLIEEVGIGGVVQNDFAEYVHLLTRKCYKGKVTFRKVHDDMFDPNATAKARSAGEIQGADFQLLDSDFADGGAEINRIRKEMQSFKSGLPLSFIDSLRERIIAETREQWDTLVPGDASTANISKTYVFGEITGRTAMLIKSGNDWIVQARERPSTKLQFAQYNGGEELRPTSVNIDVLLINESGAVGQSAQSSIKFYDKRPRIMYIAESELDVNIEVQKRGRIFRTGQVNMPAYTYIVSLVPAEIRRIIALRSKLRKLDANISANQTQSSEMADIRDSNGNPIEDIYNKYGIEAFNEQFITDPQNLYYRMLYESSQCGKSKAFSFIKKSDTDRLIAFGRELDIETSDKQESFYDQMNVRYRETVAAHVANGTFQLELETENLKAALKERAVISLGLGESEFSSPLFLEDKYTLEVRKTLTKDKVEKTTEKLCVELNNEPNPDKCHEKFIKDFQTGYDVYIAYVTNLINESKPNVEDYEDEESYESKLDIWNKSLGMRISKLTEKKDDLSIVTSKMRGRVSENDKGLLDFFVPGKGVVIEDWLIGLVEDWGDEADVVATEGGGEDATTTDKSGKVAPAKMDAMEVARMRIMDNEKGMSYVTARFLGYRLTPVSKLNPYSDGSIELHFALLDGNPPVLILKPSKNFRALKRIKETTIRLFGNPSWDFKRKNDEWYFDPNQRNVRRFLSGNILSGIVRANEMSERDRNMDGKKNIKDWGLIRYTNYDGSISTGITLAYKGSIKNDSLFTKTKTRVDASGTTTWTTGGKTPVTVPLAHPKLVEYAQALPAVWEDSTLKRYNAVVPVDIGLIRIVRPKEFPDSFELQVGVHATVKNKGNKNLSPTQAKSSEFYNPYYYDDAFNDLIKDRYIQGSASGNIDGLVYNKAGIKSQKTLSVKRYLFRVGNSGDIKKFESAMKYIWDRSKFMALFPPDASEAYAVSELKDVFDPKNKDKTEHLFPQANGEDAPLNQYRYVRLANRDDSPPLPSQMVVDEDNENGNGVVFLNLPIRAEQALAYKIYPPALPNDITVKLFFAMFDEQTRAKITHLLNDAVKDKISNYDIGDMIEKEASYKITGLEYIFGDRSTSQIGELLKTYAAKGDLSKIVFEVKEEIIAKPETEKIKDVTFERAEKYLISMLS